MTGAEVRVLQRDLNAFTHSYLRYYPPLRVDGEMGRSTKHRVKVCKFYLGYPAKQRNAAPGSMFRRRLAHPHGLRYSTPWQQAAGANRRRKQRRAATKNHEAAAATKGVGSFDGRPCANWLIPYLQYARGNGWDGILVSGWRDPVYSEYLCREMCGAPSCPGRCAGRASNHSGSVKPHGAVDVTSYVAFARIIRSCPFQPRIFNDLPRDLVHFSATGR